MTDHDATTTDCTPKVKIGMLMCHCGGEREYKPTQDFCYRIPPNRHVCDSCGEVTYETGKYPQLQVLYGTKVRIVRLT